MNAVNSKSGPQIFRAREAGEVREVQFEIQQACPSASQVNRESLAEMGLPVAVWVNWPPQQNDKGWCDSRVLYRVTGAEVQRAQEFWPDAHIGSFVCEHMGRLIE